MKTTRTRVAAALVVAASALHAQTATQTWVNQNFVSNSALTTKLAGYPTNSALTTALSPYAKTSALSAYATTAALSSYAKAADLSAYAKTSALSAYATTAALSSYAKAADLSAYAKTSALSGYATASALNGLSATVGTKASQSDVASLQNRALLFNSGIATPPSGSDIEFIQDPTTRFGTYISATDVGFYSGSDAGNLYFHKNPSALGINLSYANRGGTGDIFTSNLTGITFPRAVNIAGTLNFTNAATANATGTITFPQDSASRFGTYISATDIGFYSGTDAGNMYFRKNPAALGMSLSYANRGGTGDFFTTNLYGTSFPKNVNVGGDLVVKGNTIAMGIPQSNVADYVFEADYKLASLSEVEAYTQQHKHLPEVPSAKEISEGGLNLTEMNLTLLKKVEELTLHMIAQQKEIDGLKQRVQGL